MTNKVFLVIDDDESMHYHMCKMITESNNICNTIRDINLGKHYVDFEKPDFILCDFAFPERQTPIFFIEEIKDRFVLDNFYLVTDYESIVDTIDFTIGGIVKKPFTKEDLQNIIRNYRHE